MTAVDRRVDQAGAPVGVAHEIAAPQVAVQARRRFGRADQRRRSSANRRAKSRFIRADARPVVGGQAQLRLEPALAVERRPARAGSARRAVRLRQAPDEVVVVDAEPGRAEAVQRRQPAPQRLVEAARRPPAPHQLQHQELHRVAGPDNRDHLGQAQRARLGEPAQAARLGREHRRRRVGVGLHEQLAPVGQRDLRRVVDGAAPEAARTHDRRAQHARPAPPRAASPPLTAGARGAAARGSRRRPPGRCRRRPRTRARRRSRDRARRPRRPAPRRRPRTRAAC